MAAHPSWPNIGMFRRRAEAALWQEHRDPATVRRFFAAGPPIIPKGRFALGREIISGRAERGILICGSGVGEIGHNLADIDGAAQADP